MLVSNNKYTKPMQIRLNSMSHKDKEIMSHSIKEIEAIIKLSTPKNSLQIAHFLMGKKTLEELPSNIRNHIINRCQNILTENISCFFSHTKIKAEIAFIIKDLLRSNQSFLSERFYKEDKEKTKAKLDLLNTYFKQKDPKVYFKVKMSSNLKENITSLINLLPLMEFSAIDFIASDAYKLSKIKINLILSSSEIYILENKKLKICLNKIKRHISNLNYIQRICKYRSTLNNFIKFNA